MDLERIIPRFCTVVQILASSCLFFHFLACPASAQSKKPALIRDTEESAAAADNPAPKERNPNLSEQNVGIGDFYFKKKNYAAAIRRYIEAIEYQPDSARAYDALARAYE